MLYHVSLLIEPVGTHLIPTTFVDRIEERAGVFFWDSMKFAKLQFFPLYQGVLYQVGESHLEDRVEVRPGVWKVTRLVPIDVMEIVETKEGPEAPGIRAYVTKRIANMGL